MEWTSQASMLGQIVGVRDAVAVHVGSKGVACLVRHDLDVMLRAVEVGKNERDIS